MHQLRNESMFSHHQLIKILLLASLWVSLSTTALHIAFTPAVWTAMAFPSVLNFSTFMLCSRTSSAWGVLFPLLFPGLKSIHLSQISGSSLGYCYLQPARSHDQKCYSSKCSAHLTFESDDHTQSNAISFERHLALV